MSEAPWQSRDPAVRAEADVATEGGLYGWDLTLEGVDNPIPFFRRADWQIRREARLDQAGRLNL